MHGKPAGPGRAILAIAGLLIGAALARAQVDVYDRATTDAAWVFYTSAPDQASARQTADEARQHLHSPGGGSDAERNPLRALCRRVYEALKAVSSWPAVDYFEP